MQMKEYDKSEVLAIRRLGMVCFSPELNKMQCDALLAVINNPTHQDDKFYETVEISQDIMDVYRSFVPEDVLRDFINFLLAKTIYNRVRRAKSLRAYYRSNRLLQEFSKWGARIRWDNWKKKVEAGEIQPVRKGGKRIDWRVMVNAESHKVFMGMAKKKERRRVFSNWIVRAILAGIPEDAEFVSEKCTHSAYMSKEAHDKFLEFAKSVGHPSSSVLNYLIKKYGMEMAF